MTVKTMFTQLLKSAQKLPSPNSLPALAGGKLSTGPSQGLAWLDLHGGAWGGA